MERSGKSESRDAGRDLVPELCGTTVSLILIGEDPSEVWETSEVEPEGTQVTEQLPPQPNILAVDQLM